MSADKKQMDKVYKEFGKLMIKERIYRSPIFSFRRICRLLQVSEQSLDSLLRAELGMGGRELLRAFRKNDNKTIVIE